MTRSGAASIRSVESALLLPAVVLVAVVTAWVATGGGYESQPALAAGYEPDPWYLGALAVVGLACATVAGARPTRVARSTKVACAALLAYVLWSFASVLWAHDQGSAFLGSNRALVYLAAFVAFAALPWRDAIARLAAGALAGAVGVIAVIAAFKVAHSATPSALYLGARLSYPLGYYNADAVLFMATATLAIALSARRSSPAALRVAGTTIAAVCLQLAVLSQSRGWLFSAPIVLLAMLVLIPNRLRLLGFALGPAVATAAISPALLRVYGHGAPGGNILPQPRLNAVLHAEGNRAAHAMLIADLVLAAVAFAMVRFDRRVRLAPTAQRRVDRLARILAVAAALAGVTVGLVAIHGDIAGRVEGAWKSFAHPPAPTGGGYSHFTTLASNRTDIWRVALHEFFHHPVGGLGQDNFAASYIRLRRTYEQPRWTHSIELRLLTHTGAIGAALFVLFLGAALVAALRGRRGHERVTAGILLVWLVVWLVQGSIDWFWEYPALTVPAFALLAAAGALGRSGTVPPEAPPGAPRRGGRWLAATAGVLLALGAVAALLIPFAAARHAQAATVLWEEHPARAYAEVRAAADLLPFDSQLYLLGGSIALNSGEYALARQWLSKAEKRDDQNWLTPFALGLVEGEEGRLGAARTYLRRAEALNPLEPTVGTALDRVKQGRPITFAEAQRMLSPHIVTPRT